MDKDVNIHVKTTGTQQSASELSQVGHATEEVGAKSSRAAGWIKEAFTALVGPLGIAAAVGLVVGAVRKIVAAFDDMKRASAEAVAELANQQRAAASFFESVNAYSGPQRKTALAQARGVQATTGLPFESSMKLLEAQQRTFGEINPKSTEQFAAYWKLHAGEQTPNMIRWMGASGIKTPEQQGQIMRMIGAAGQGKPEEQIIEAISGQSERFKALGWTPEQTITNIGKLLKGMSAEEAPKALRGMFGSLEGFDEAKALEMKAPKGVAESEPARLEWLKTKTAGLPLKQRNTLLRQAFGPTYPYVNKMLFEPTSPELQQELNYAASPQAAAEAAQNAAAYRGTAEGQTEISKGKSIRPEGSFSPDDITNVLTRDKGKAYLEYLKIHDPKKYASLQFRGSPFGMGIGAIINESPEELAAMELWQMTLPAKTSAKEKVGGFLTESHRWHELPPAEQLAGAEQGSRMININYNTNTIYNPVAGTAADRDIGPRADRDLK